MSTGDSGRRWHKALEPRQGGRRNPAPNNTETTSPLSPLMDTLPQVGLGVQVSLNTAPGAAGGAGTGAGPGLPGGAGRGGASAALAGAHDHVGQLLHLGLAAHVVHDGQRL